MTEITEKFHFGRSSSRFALAVSFFVVALVAAYRHPVIFEPIGPAEHATAAAVAAVVRAVGVEVARTGNLLVHPSGFGFEVYHRCTGLVHSVLLVVGLLALPGRRRAKAIGIIAGVLLVLAANLARLVTLYLVAVHAPEALDFLHAVVWEALMLIVVLGCWTGWLRHSYPAGISHHVASRERRHARRLTPLGTKSGEKSGLVNLLDARLGSLDLGP